VAKARDPDDLVRAFAQFVDARASAIVVSNDAFFLKQRAQLIALAKGHSLPAIYEWREFPADGGLMSYGPSLVDIYQQLGVYASRILNGEQPSDLPVQQPITFRLVINLKTAKALGLEVPLQLLYRADEVIE
jgi:putative tryptophan/tyrosine transport system substrate-binding protein